MIGRVIRKEQFKVLDRRGINIYDSPNINGYGGLVSYFAIGIDKMMIVQSVYARW